MRKALICFLVLCLLLSVLPLHSNAQELLIAPNPVGDPAINITTAEEFLAFSENCRLDSFSAGKTVFLDADIDLTGLNFSGIPIFSGTFHGNGHRISGLCITDAGSRRGLFRILTESAFVQELTVEGNVTPSGSSSYIGGIAGMNAGTVLSCSFNGTVGGMDSVGGIVGCNSITGILENCSASGMIHGTHFIGGIAGENTGVVRGCENRADINTTVSQNSVAMEDITLDSLMNSESVITVTDIGGICGTGTGVIRDCKNLGSVGYPQIGYNVGGIAGRYSGYIYHCINEGNIDGRKEVGGIAGQLEPAVSMTFAQDTLQILEGQMDTMAALTNRTASHVQNSVSALETQVGDLENHVSAVQGALDILLPDREHPFPPDLDTILAAQNTLSSSLGAISGTLESMESTGEDALKNTYKDFMAITGQMNEISATIGNAQEHINASIADISDSDTDADMTAKIDACQNAASVSAGWNTGGIVGSISFENSLDPDSDLQILGNTSANFAYEFRAVISGCENTSPVTGKKQNTGGIVGLMSLGLAKNCVNAGTVTGSGYTGGIAGLSRGYIRCSIARCLIQGGAFTGGIAGLGATLSDCNAMVRLANTVECNGAILGSMDKDTHLENNHYLPIGHDIGAVDGISYEGKAQALSAMEFFALDTLPEKFHYMTVTFHFEDGTVKILTMPYASKLTGKQIPEIEPKSGHESHWTGDVKLTDQLFFDTDFYISRTPHIPTLESETVSENGMPLLLAQGDFLRDQTVDITKSDDIWLLSLPQSQTDLILRFLLPNDHSADSVILQLQNADGTWTDAPFAVSGSYLVFPAAEDIQALRLQTVEENYALYIWIGIGIAIVLGVIVLVSKKKKK